MRLSEPLNFTDKVKSIPLAERNPAPGTVAMVSGWGATSTYPKLSYPVHLQGVDVLILGVNQFFLFAGSYGQTSCFGDSGGPLVVDQQLVGVVSGVFEYCDGPTQFISVSDERSWLLNAIASIKL